MKLSALAPLLTILLLAPAAQAASASVWNVPSGDWNTPGNWIGGVPDASIQAQIGTTSSNRTATVTTANAAAWGVVIGLNSGNIGTVTVDGGTLNSHTMNSFIGYEGTGTLNVQSGGKFLAHDYVPIVGYGADSTGFVTVTGAGSQLTSDDGFYVGYDGAGTLTIQSSGKIVAENTATVIGVNSGSTGTIGVSGAASQLISRNGVFVGYDGTGTLSVEADGTIKTDVGYGAALAYVGSSKGTLNLYGTPGSRGVLETNFIYEGTGTGGGHINFHGGILRATADDPDFIQDFEIGDVEILFGGAYLDTNGYNVSIATGLQGTSGGSLTKQGAGTLTLTGASSNNGSTYVEAGTLLVSAGSLSSGGDTEIGTNSGSATLTIQNGGTVSNTHGHISINAGSTSLATVTGTGSQWINSGGLSVGEYGNGTLVIQNSGVVSNTTGTIGSGTGSTGLVTVSGTGSLWTNSSGLYVGNFGSGTLDIQNGGVVSNTIGTIGYGTGSTSLVTVSGAGSQWANSSYLQVGYYGSGTLDIQNGGVVSNTNGIIGQVAGSTGLVTVSGTGSQWTNSSNLNVGRSGSGTLTVEAGGKVSTGAGYGTTLAIIGSTTGTLNLNGTSGSRGVLETAYLNEGNGTGGGHVNFDGGILRATADSADFLQNFEAGDVQIASGGAFFDTNGHNVTVNSTVLFGGTGGITKQGAGTLTLTGDRTYYATNTVEAGTLANAIGYVGYGSGDTSSITVSGSGSQWTNSGELNVADGGNGALNIQDGGVVSSGTGYIGRAGGSTGLVTVDGTGSQWINSGGLYVAYGGNGTLNIQNGGVVSSDYGFIGYDTGSTGTVTVDGSGSQWNNMYSLDIGGFASGTLTIRNGGTVRDTDGAVGNNSGTAAVTVTGPGSQWINTDELLVGRNGSGSLTIQGGGTVTSSFGHIGFDGGSNGTVTVDGIGSQWNNGQFIGIGYVSNSGTLTIQNGGMVSTTDCLIGYNTGCTGLVTVSGSGSQLTNSSSLYVGYSGNGTLTVADGGRGAAATSVTLADNGSGTGTLNLNGTSGSRGVLETAFISEGSGTGGGHINFNGGILRATADSADFLQNFEAGDVQIQSGGAFIVTNGHNVTIATVFQGGGGLTKQDEGTLTLTGTHSYTGPTTVEAGTLSVTGGLTSDVAVQSGGTLGGSGTVGAVNVLSGGTLAAGNSIESLATGNLTLSSNSLFAFEMNNDASPGVAGDLTVVTGTLNLPLSNDANLSLTELGSGSWSLGEKLTLISYSGAWNGGLFKLGGNTLADDSLFAFSGMDWKFNYNDSSAGGNWSGDLTGPGFVTMTAVPEPGRLLFVGCSFLVLLRRRKILARREAVRIGAMFGGQMPSTYESPSAANTRDFR
ncbi:MAG: autotransporter-associated beta strand repeat-containing protein [Verrucomicrobiales bacterium]|nr:autotransporter-associated beta strand repeat-containing protein [Verrucomicrobiales bacterium]